MLQVATPHEVAAVPCRDRWGRLAAPVVVVVAALAAAGCGGSGAHDDGAGAAPLGEAISLEQTRRLASVDWEEVTYLSVCGLSGVRVRGGVGEASSLGATYGVEVVDADLADLDGDGVEDAAVLVDCLGGDSYSPHVIVVPSDGVSAGDEPRVAVAAGGSLPAGDRPVDIDARAGGRIDVEVSDAGEPAAYTLHYAPDVLLGGELPSPPGTRVTGVLTSVDGGVAVVAVAPDAGYRLGLPPATPVLDPDRGGAVPVESALGRQVDLSVGEGGSVAAIALVPAGS